MWSKRLRRHFSFQTEIKMQNHTNNLFFSKLLQQKCINPLTELFWLYLALCYCSQYWISSPWEPASLNTALVWLWPSINVPVTEFRWQLIVFVSEGRGRPVNRTTLEGQSVFHYSGSERAEPHHSSSFNGWTGWQGSTAENGNTAVWTLGTIMGLGNEGCCVCLRGVWRKDSVRYSRLRWKS